MIPQNRNFFVIIVHFGDPNTTTQAVASLLSPTSAPAKILVIDHGTKPLKLSFSPQQVIVVRPHSNEGYAAGCNLGLGWLGQQGAKPDDIVVCMNNDLVLEKGAWQELTRWWQERLQPAFASPSVIETSGNVLHVSTVNWLTGRALPYKPYRGLLRLFGWPYLHGACVSAPYSAWMRVNGWPQGFNMYWEDVALSGRAKTARIPLYIISSAQVQHSSQPNTPPTGLRLYHLVRNGAWVLSHQGPFATRFYWRLINRLRYFWHRLHRHEEIARAIHDSFTLKLC